MVQYCPNPITENEDLMGESLADALPWSGQDSEEDAATAEDVAAENVASTET